MKIYVTVNMSLHIDVIIESIQDARSSSRFKLYQSPDPRDRPGVNSSDAFHHEILYPPHESQ